MRGAQERSQLKRRLVWLAKTIRRIEVGDQPNSSWISRIHSTSRLEGELVVVEQVNEGVVFLIESYEIKIIILGFEWSFGWQWAVN